MAPETNQHKPHRKHAAKAGPSADDRYGDGPVGENIDGRIMGVSFVNQQTQIKIHTGDKGVRVGMEGNVKGLGAQLQVIEVKGGIVIAVVTNATLDQLQGKSFVVINPTSTKPSGKRRPVQRRASGGATTADVNATAQAGVAGATHPLPHFDAIQRAFGKHDVSAIQAQVGGPATTAAQSLGAEAYATGNQVAFASSPDLHTAAHEAAHAIQQRHGAVGFQGLGAADDEHERHADAVADAVVRGESAEPLLDRLAVAGTSARGAVQRKELTSDEKLRLVRGGRDATKLIRQLVRGVPAQLAVLQEARESANPSSMRSALGAVESTRALLELARTSAEAAVHATAPSERPALEGAIASAAQQIPELVEPVRRARDQASLLEVAATGSLSAISTGAAPNSPEETRRRAAGYAPLGLCDDTTMQSPTSRACPLEMEQRTAVRERVVREIGTVAENWSSAIAEAQLDFRLKPLLAQSGVNPLVSILLGAVTGWLLGLALQQLRNVEALAANPGAKIPASLKMEDKLIMGLHKKLADVLTKPGKPKAHESSSFFDALKALTATWTETASNDVRQLPDPVLVVLGESLHQANFSIPFFREKIGSLVANYDEVRKIGHTTLDGKQPMVAIFVMHPTGASRIALAHPTTMMIPNHAPKLGSEPGEDYRERHDGNFAFHAWVDRALETVVIATNVSMPVLMSNDARWRGRGGSKLLPRDFVEWHEQPSKTDDVKMFERGAV